MDKLVSKSLGLVKTGFELGKPAMQKIRYYAMVELVPPKISDLPHIRSNIGKIITSAKTGGYRNLTMREAILNTLVTVEVMCWFFIGECIGKRHIVGYKV